MVRMVKGDLCILLVLVPTYAHMVSGDPKVQNAMVTAYVRLVKTEMRRRKLWWTCDQQTSCSTRATVKHGRFKLDVASIGFELILELTPSKQNNRAEG